MCAVFIHGFMGSPAQFSRLAEVARAAGSQSRLITLPGHGGGVREFMRAGRSAWLAHVETELADLRAQHEKLLLVGHSMGGLLAINAAAKQPEGIAGILALALPLYLRATANGLRIRVHSVLPARPEEDPRVCAARELRGVQGVTLWNAPALVPNSLGLLRLMAQTRKALPNLAVPLDVINSAEDELVSRRSLAFVRERLPRHRFLNSVNPAISGIVNTIKQNWNNTLCRRCKAQRRKAEAQTQRSGISRKPQISRSLKGEPAAIAFGEHAVFLAGNAKLHAVPAFHLKSDIIGGGGMVMVHACAAGIVHA